MSGLVDFVVSVWIVYTLYRGKMVAYILLNYKDKNILYVNRYVKMLGWPSWASSGWVLVGSGSVESSTQTLPNSVRIFGCWQIAESINSIFFYSHGMMLLFFIRLLGSMSLLYYLSWTTFSLWISPEIFISLYINIRMTCI